MTYTYKSPSIINPTMTLSPWNYIYNTSSKPDYGFCFKAKRAGTKTSHVVFILDCSSSMEKHKAQTISGFNEFLNTHKQSQKQTGIETFISLYNFDGNSVYATYERKPVDHVEPLTSSQYQTTGSTNLVDAFGSVITNVNNKLKEVKKSERDQVIIVALTDGEENTSRTFDNNDIKQMVQKCEKKNWGFVFLGANIDAFAVSASWGFNKNNTLQYNTSNMSQTLKAAARTTADMKANLYNGTDVQTIYQTSMFTDQERKESNGQ